MNALFCCAVAVFKKLVVVTEGERRTPKHTLEVNPEDEAEHGGGIRATIAEDCPKCKHPELEYHTMQLRSADEGQTVFYTCLKCGHTFSTNT